MAEHLASPEPNAASSVKQVAVSSVAIVGIFFALLFGLLFACGLWSANATEGSSAPQLSVKVVGGGLPGVVVESKKGAAGTMKTPADVSAVREK